MRQASLYLSGLLRQYGTIKGLDVSDAGQLREALRQYLSDLVGPVIAETDKKILNAIVNMV